MHERPQMNSSNSSRRLLDDNKNNYRCISSTYDDTSRLPMWSVGFARGCCDVYPNKFLTGNQKRTYFEQGDPGDSNYFKRRGIKNGDAVYVVTSDLPAFINDVFVKLPMTTKIVLVTGSEDIGTPYEVFHPNRPNFFDYKMSALWPQGQKLSLKAFLSDTRLSKWIAQNWDLIGCNMYTCSSLSTSTDPAAMLAKVIPLPIGLDLHSFAEKKEKDQRRANALVCEQLDLLHTELLGAPPFVGRILAILAEFQCTFDSSRIGEGRKKTRGELCRLILSHQKERDKKTWNQMHEKGYGEGEQDIAAIITHHDHIIVPPSVTILHGREKKTQKGKEGNSRTTFWHRLRSIAFAFSPAGFGVDTHRTWEILHMGAVPIVLRSPLDALHRQFPIVIVDQWSDAFAPGALNKFKRDIMTRFPQFATGESGVKIPTMGNVGHVNDNGNGTMTTPMILKSKTSPLSPSAPADGDSIVYSRLGMAYWIDLVQQEKTKILNKQQTTLLNTFL